MAHLIIDTQDGASINGRKCRSYALTVEHIHIGIEEDGYCEPPTLELIAYTEEGEKKIIAIFDEIDKACNVFSNLLKALQNAEQASSVQLWNVREHF